MKDNVHLSILENWLKILYKLLNTQYKQINQYVFFSGWTSLMFKYSNFPRFSKDLDFAVSISWKKYDKTFYQLFTDLRENLEKYCNMNDIPVFSSFSNWREFVFQWEFGVCSIKIDFMYDYVLWYENCCKIKKVSDLDIFVNKLQRLSKTDLKDLQFLQKANNFSIEQIIDWIRKKWEYLHGNKYYLDTKIINNLNKVKSFNFLIELKNELTKI